MLKFLLVATSILASLPLGAATTKGDFNKKWAYSPLLKNSLNKSTNETKIFKRFVWDNNKPIPVAESVATIVKGAQEKSDLQDLAKKIDKSFGGKMEMKGTLDKLELHGPFPKLNRMIDVTLQKRGDNFLIITTFTRLGFYPSLKNDVTELHQMATSYFNETSKNTTVVQIWNSFSNFVLSSAHAQSLPSFPSSVFGGSSSPTPFIVQVDTGLGDIAPVISTQGDQFNATINTQGNQINNTLNVQGNQINATVNNQGNQLNDTLNAQGNQFNATVNNQGNQLNNTLNTQGNQFNATINAQGNQINKTLNDQGNQLNHNISSATDVIEHQGGQLNANLGDLNVQAGSANQNWSESNRLLSQAMDPNHMAKVAFYTAAGAALGAFTMNLAIQGASKGIGFLLELFTHNKRNKLEWDDFQKAMEVWDTQLNDLVKMEKIVDNFLNAFQFFKDKNMGTNYPQILTTAIRGMGMDKELFMEKFHDPSQDKACRELYYNAAAELEDKIGEYKKLLELVGSNSMVSDSPKTYFCGQLSEFRRRILAAEQAMQNLRLKILLAENQYYDKQKKNQQKSDQTANAIEARRSKSENEQRERREEVERNVRHKLASERKDWIRSCYKGEISPGDKFKSDHSMSSSDRKKACASAYTPPAGIAVADTLDDEAEIRNDLSIMNNDYIDVNLTQQQQQWFTKIHMDAFCYQYAHRPDSEMPDKCKKFPETLYSIGLTRAYNKADAAYKGSCAQRYSDSVSAIARSGRAKEE